RTREYHDLRMQLGLFSDDPFSTAPKPCGAAFGAQLKAFDAFGTTTQTLTLECESGAALPVYVNEFWTAKQRAAHSLHEISYRACFKPQLPRFFIERLTEPGDWIYDPFMGRGTTLLEGALLGRRVAGGDVN